MGSRSQGNPIPPDPCAPTAQTNPIPHDLGAQAAQGNPIPPDPWAQTAQGNPIPNDPWAPTAQDNPITLMIPGRREPWALRFPLIPGPREPRAILLPLIPGPREPEKGCLPEYKLQREWSSEARVCSSQVCQHCYGHLPKICFVLEPLASMQIRPNS